MKMMTNHEYYGGVAVYFNGVINDKRVNKGTSTWDVSRIRLNNLSPPTATPDPNPKSRLSDWLDQPQPLISETLPLF